MSRTAATRSSERLSSLDASPNEERGARAHRSDRRASSTPSQGLPERAPRGPSPSPARSRVPRAPTPPRRRSGLRRAMAITSERRAKIGARSTGRQQPPRMLVGDERRTRGRSSPRRHRPAAGARARARHSRATNRAAASACPSTAETRRRRSSNPRARAVAQLCRDHRVGSHAARAHSIAPRHAPRLAPSRARRLRQELLPARYPGAPRRGQDDERAAPHH